MLRRAGRRIGFTLLELLVALTVAGVVVLLAHRVFAASGEAGRRLAAARQALDREANARRLLRATFESLDVGDGAGSFQGRATRVEFSAWVQTAGGWLERRRLVLAHTGSQLELRGLTWGSVALADSVTGLSLDYLLEPGAGAAWMREWVSPLSAPVAVRVRIARAGVVDTMLLVVGPRG
jgi:prepilin-type N-terminal cleavage/methylation domain-containing protein